jgi:hypothetical protein
MNTHVTQTRLFSSSRSTFSDFKAQAKDETKLEDKVELEVEPELKVLGLRVWPEP